MTIKALYPTVRPTLNLDFAKAKVLDPRVTFTRASTATFVGANGLIQTAASGVPRFDHNPSTGESLGLLVEEPRTNSLPYSQGFTAGWHTANAQVTTGQADPAGGTNAILVKQTNGTSTRQYISSSASTNILANFTVSVFVKYVNYDYVILSGVDEDPGPAGVDFGGLLPKLRFQFSTETLALQESTWPSATATLSYGFQKFPNGWYRIWFTRSTAVRTNYWGIAVQSDYAVGISNLSTVVGDNSSSVLAFGFQVEQGAFPTSYIPTSGATVTRAADVANITGTNFSSWYNQSAGSLFGSFVSLSNGANAPIAAFSQTSNPEANRISLRIASSFCFTNSVVQFSFPTSYTANQSTKVAWGFGSTATYYKNGTLIGTDSSVTLPATIDVMAIGTLEANSGFPINGTIARLTYYPVRLPDAQLQALTAT